MVTYACASLLIIGLQLGTGVTTNEASQTSEKNTSFESSERRTVRILGDQASDGKCLSFSADDSSKSPYYICCNNCYKRLPSFTPHCDGETYQQGSSQANCNSCGVDKSKTSSLFQSEFYCGGCSGQNFVNQTCSATWNNVSSTCWAFVSCMKTTCVNMFEELGIMSNCGNKYCNIDETSDTCPIDCCFKKSASCTWGSECLPKCCGEKSCCKTSSSEMLKTEIAFFALIPFICYFIF